MEVLAMAALMRAKVFSSFAPIGEMAVYSKEGIWERRFEFLRIGEGRTQFAFGYGCVRQA